MRVRGARGGDDLVARRLGLAVGDVLGDRAEEQERLLQHEPDVAPVFGHRQRADVDAVDADRPLGHVVEAADQVHQRALARAAVADQADHLARRDLQVDAADDAPVAVAEPHVADVDLAPHLREVHRAASGSGTLDTWSRMSKIRFAPAAAFCVTETMRLIESSRV